MEWSVSGQTLALARRCAESEPRWSSSLQRSLPAYGLQRFPIRKVHDKEKLSGPIRQVLP